MACSKMWISISAPVWSRNHDGREKRQRAIMWHRGTDHRPQWTSEHPLLDFNAGIHLRGFETLAALAPQPPMVNSDHPSDNVSWKTQLPVVNSDHPPPSMLEDP